MTIATDYTTEIENRQFERELFDRLEQRRQVADRAVEKLGSRIAFASYLARRARAARAA